MNLFGTHKREGTVVCYIKTTEWYSNQGLCQVKPYPVEQKSLKHGLIIQNGCLILFANNNDFNAKKCQKKMLIFYKQNWLSLASAGAFYVCMFEKSLI